MSLRRAIFLALLLLLFCGLFIGGTYLYTLDLNSYREQIETLLAERIDKPVSLGNAHLSFKHGPAFAFDDVRIGSANDDLFATTRHLFFRLRTLPLLTGDIRFSEILLENPDVSLRLRPRTEPDKLDLALPAEQQYLEGELVRSLRINNGTIHVTDQRRGDREEELVIENLRFSVDDFSFLSAGNIRANATLLHRGVRSPVSLEGEYRPTGQTRSWDGAYYRFTLAGEHLAAKSLKPWLDDFAPDAGLRGYADLKLSGEGIPADGVSVSAHLTGKGLDLTSSRPDTPPRPIHNIRFNGRGKYLRGVAIEASQADLDLVIGGDSLSSSNTLRLTLNGGRLREIKGNGSFSRRPAVDGSNATPTALSHHLLITYRYDLLRDAAGWLLQSAQLGTAGADLQLHGAWQPDASPPLTLEAALPETDLRVFSALSPALNHLEPGGQISAELILRAGDATPPQLSGSLNLQDVHIAIPGQLADLNGLSGTLRAENGGLFATGLQADLGRSPISIDLKMPDLHLPDLSLHVRGESIRADELIFPSQQLFLRQVDGVVRLADGQLYLGPVDVKMDGGTDATVSGTVKNFDAADVALQIRARHGNIDEIIDLWHTETPIAEPETPIRRGSLLIDIETDSGQIFGMHFDHATSQIVRRNDTLVIGPISFRAGAGEGLGQVLVEHRRNAPSRLKISGHLTDFDAETIYRQLLKRNGLVSGRLDGDFYLEGLTGGHFRSTSFGAFAVKISDGRLNRLTGLAKILQFLNLYPVLTENVQGKGLPFDVITFNTALHEGVLSTEDLLLKGDIMNLSMVGRYDINDNSVDFELGAMPLRSVDSILAHIPIAGWLLTGKEKALVVAHFTMTGDADDPDVEAVPTQSVTAPVIGIFERVFTLPVKVFTDPEQVIINK